MCLGEAFGPQIYCLNRKSFAECLAPTDPTDPYRPYRPLQTFLCVPGRSIRTTNLLSKPKILRRMLGPYRPLGPILYEATTRSSQGINSLATGTKPTLVGYFILFSGL